MNIESNAALREARPNDSDAENMQWSALAAQWKTAYGHAYAAQNHLIDVINAQSQGHPPDVIRIHMRITDEMWAIEARRRAELNRYVKKRFG